MLLAAAWAPFIESFGSLFKYLQTVLAFIAPPIVVVFLLIGSTAFALVFRGLDGDLWIATEGGGVADRERQSESFEGHRGRPHHRG